MVFIRALDDNQIDQTKGLGKILHKYNRLTSGKLLSNALQAVGFVEWCVGDLNFHT